MTISEKVYALIHSHKTLTTAFATATTGPDHDVFPGLLAKTLYDEHPKHHSFSGSNHLETFKELFRHTGKNDVERIQVIEPTQEDLDLAAQCGNFGSRPSDLFLKVSTISHCLSWQLYMWHLDFHGRSGYSRQRSLGWCGVPTSFGLQRGRELVYNIIVGLSKAMCNAKAKVFQDTRHHATLL